MGWRMKSRTEAYFDQEYPPEICGPDPLDALRAISGTNQLEKMRAMMDEATYVIPDMVTSGTITQFFSLPNGGKTLFVIRSLIDAIREGRVKGRDVFYINEDDQFRGFLSKSEIADKYGFVMVSSARSDDEAIRDAASVLKTILGAAHSDNVQGKVFVFDTLKKFTDLMNKEQLKTFFKALRVITGRGGTVILLGHANKHLVDGKLIFEGMGDIKADIDVQYAIYGLSERTDSNQVIKFVNEKDRGDVVMERTMQYTKTQGCTYEELLFSLSVADDSEVARLEQEARRAAIYKTFEGEVPYILEAIQPGDEVLMTEFVAEFMRLTTHEKTDAALNVRGRNQLRLAVEALVGYDLTMSRGNKGAKVLSRSGSLADKYRQKDGE